MTENRQAGGTGRVCLTGNLVCANTREIEIVLQYLPEHVRLTRAEAGCVSFDVAQTPDPLIWRVEECFVDQAAFDAHQTRARSSAWAEATASIRREYKISAG